MKYLSFLLILLLAILLLLPIARAEATEIELTPANTVVFEGVIEPFMMMQFVSEVTVAASVQRDVYVLIYSPGGQVDPLLAAVPVLQGYKNVHPVVIKAASGAAALSQILLGKRYMTRNGELLFHKVRIMASGILTIDDLRQIVHDLNPSDYIFNDLCSRRLKISIQQYVTMVTNNDWYMNAYAAKGVGAVDAIGGLKCSDAFRAVAPIVGTYSPYLAYPLQTSICNLLN